MTGTSFESFYLRKVALNEGCGCAEQIIGTRDLERRSQEAAVVRDAVSDPLSATGWLRRLFRASASRR